MWAVICASAKWVSFINKGTPNEGTRNVREEDVINFYADLFHNENSIKAAEFFTKYYNMLDKNGDTASTVVIVDDIGSVKNE